MATFVSGSRKRRRVDRPTVFVASQKRPIDKSIVFFNHANAADATQNQTPIAGPATFPCTITGLRWNIDVETDSLTEVFMIWAIVILREGVAADTISFSGGASIYQPEQNVLAWGYCNLPPTTSSGGPEVRHFEGTTKTMRKLMMGDQIVVITKPSAVHTGNVGGVIQSFCKS